MSSLYAPQYAILLTMVLTTFIKYLLHTIDLQSENPWDNKAVYMLYTELFTGTVFSCCSKYDAGLLFFTAVFSARQFGFSHCTHNMHIR